PLATRPKSVLPFDLHVLGMPPAFNLSQDQTLHLKLLMTEAIYLLSESFKSQAFIADSWYSDALADGLTGPSAGVRTNYLRTLSKIFRLAGRPEPSTASLGHFVEASRTSYIEFPVRQHLSTNFFSIPALRCQAFRRRPRCWVDHYAWV